VGIEEFKFGYFSTGVTSTASSRTSISKHWVSNMMQKFARPFREAVRCEEMAVTTAGESSFAG
jgi:hypothetical protein